MRQRTRVAPHHAVRPAILAMVKFFTFCCASCFFTNTERTGAASALAGPRAPLAATARAAPVDTREMARMAGDGGGRKAGLRLYLCYIRTHIHTNLQFNPNEAHDLQCLDAILDASVMTQQINSRRTFQQCSTVAPRPFLLLLQRYVSELGGGVQIPDSCIYAPVRRLRRSSCRMASDSSPVTLVIAPAAGENFLVVDITLETPVATLRGLVAAKLAVEAASIKLVFEGSELLDGGVLRAWYGECRSIRSPSAAWSLPPLSGD